MNDFRLVPAALATWLVCAVGVWSDPAWRGVVGVGVAAAVLITGATVVAVRCREGPNGSGMATAWLAVGAVVVATTSCIVQADSRDRGLLRPLVEDRATVAAVGVVRGEVTPLRNTLPGGSERLRTVLAVERVAGRGLVGDASAQVLLIGGSQWADIPYGSRVRVEGRLAPTDPGDDMSGILTATGEPEVIGAPGALDRGVTRIRQGLLTVSDGLPADLRGLVPGTAIGDTTRLPADLDQAMRDVSLTHVTAVSGAHFAVLSVTVLGLAAALGVPRWVRAAVTAAVMAGFVLLVHPQPSVVRAAVMGGVAVLGMMVGRRSRAVPALGTAVVVLLVLDPWLARSYGFVLSVLATGAIALLAPPIAARLGFLPRWLAVAVSVPVAAQAACAPVLVLLNPGVSLYAVPANVLAAPALLPATVLGVAAAVTAPWFPSGATVLVHGAAGANWWIATVARTAAGLPGARQGWLPGPAGALALAGLIGVVLLVLLHRRARRRWLVLLVCGALGLLPAVRGPVVSLLDPWPPEGWRVVLCDVGQGDALVVRTGPGSALVVDAGPAGGAADACLERLGVHHIELLVLTHYHFDHVGGLAPVLHGRHVTQALVSPLPEPGSEAARTLAELERSGVPVAVGAVDGVLPRGQVGDVSWTVLSPALAAERGSEEDANDASVVVLVESPELTVLALGDVGRAPQERLAARWGAGLAVEVVKVAHHGSADQSERFAELLDAPVALVSVGSGNGYGHPAPSTVTRFTQLGALVLRTDECGDVAVFAGGGRLRVAADCVG